MSETLFPPGIRMGSCVDIAECPAIRIDLTLEGGEEFAIVLSPAQMRPCALLLMDQEDRRVRTLGALLLRQAQLVEEAGRYGGLRLVEGGR